MTLAGDTGKVVVVDVIEGYLDSLRAKLASDERESELVMFAKTVKVRDLGMPGQALAFCFVLDPAATLGSSWAVALSRPLC